MKISRKIIIIISGIIAFLIIFGIISYRIFVNANNLSNDEKKWLDQNNANVLSITIPNDIPIFGYTGTGVFFDFVNYLSEDLGIKVNENTVSYLSKNDGIGFEILDNYDNNKLLLYKDHYVLVSKNTGIYYDTDDIPSLGVGIISSQVDKVSEYYNTDKNSFKTYESYSDISNALSDSSLTYALVPLNEYKDELLANGINILAHISDLNKYYYLRLGSDTVANSILTKEFNKWKNKDFNDSYNKNNYKLFIDKLGITESQERELTNKEYTYGFTSNRPYEILESGEYGGITAQYLRSFSEFSNTEFTYRRYDNATDLAKAAINGDIDLYYNYYDIITNYIDCGSLGRIDYEIVADNSIDLSLSNIYGLSYRDVYVLKDSYLYDMIKDLPGININTYETPNELKKIVKKHAIIVIDSYTAKYYLNRLTNDYSSRYQGTYEDSTYTFRYRNDTDTFYKLFNAYTKTIDPSDLVRYGITTYNNVDKKGDMFGNIARYVLIIICVSVLSIFFYRFDRKKIKLNTKVKKNDKLRYMDSLTSLKNRTYYNDRLSVWNKNTIYPQACVVLDINGIKNINDSYGHVEGDKVIQAVANVLIKTQIDNTEIMRMDGNEFLVYMVGYPEKQILSYMKKLMKEFKKLPHDETVALGFSIIEDDTKLVEDCYNEALIKMRENKENYQEIIDEEEKEK